MKRLILTLTIILTFGLILAGISSYASKINEDIADSIIRLHVMANSNTQVDQELKYKVRDSILDYMRDKYGTSENGFRNLKVNEKLLNELQLIANSSILEAKKDYEVKVMFGTYPFPTKTYGELSFPAGYYKAVRVVIGEGTGKNWWCVMFPPLCMINSTSGTLSNDSKALLKEQVGEEDYKILSEGNQSADIKVKFKVVEWFQSIKIGVENLF